MSSEFSEQVQTTRSEFERALSSGADPASLNVRMSDFFDKLICALAERSFDFTNSRDKIAILALGGYGRREVGPYSDADLLFIHEDGSFEHAKHAVNEILYPLWNSGIEAGGATRSIPECVEMFSKDARALTSMMESRLIAGNSSLYEDLNKELRRHFTSKKNLKNYIELKLSERDESRKKFKDVLYSLQPNLKDGEGGIRDYHALLWIRRSIDLAGISCSVNVPSDDVDVKSAYQRIWRVRQALHIAEKRRFDILLQSAQTDVTHILKIHGEPESTPAEIMLARLFQDSAKLHLACRASFSAILDFINSKKISSFFSFKKKMTPEKIKDLSFSEELVFFKNVKRYDIPADASDLYSISLRRLPKESDLNSPTNAKLLLDLFQFPRGLFNTFLSMMESTRLQAWFPETEKMLYAFQKDGLHSFSAGMHSIVAVLELEKMFTNKEQKRSLENATSLVQRFYLLALATLFHDVGKGRGGAHSERGATLVRQIAKRLGLSSTDTHDLVLLVRSHLLMSSLAFKRDIADEQLLDKFCQTIKSPELLACLYLLSIADIKAVGPRSWNAWKKGLLEELYLRTLSAMSSGKSAPEQIRIDSQKIKREVRSYLGRHSAPAAIDGFISELPQRYLFSMSPETIAAHIMMSEKISNEKESVVTVLKEISDRGCHEFSVVSKDRPALFATIAGVIASAGASIVDAQVFTTSGDVAVDVFWVTNAQHMPIMDLDVWEKIRTDLELVLSGKKTLDEILKHKIKRTLLSPKVQKPVVSIDNDLSTEHSVLEVRASDRIGLLYSIAAALSMQNVEIDRAMISTQVDRIIDVFYIRKRSGGKIVEEQALAAINQAVAKAIEE